MRRPIALGAVTLLALAGCSAEPEVREVTVTESTTVVAESPSTSGSAQADPDCSNAALQRSPRFEQMEFLADCEAGFARAGVPQSDHTALVQWNGSSWNAVPADGIWDGMGLQKQCYNPGTLKQFADKELRCGVYGPGEEPPHLQSTAAKPQPNWDDAKHERYIPYVGLGEMVPKYASHPACDGRGILILDSIIDYGDRSDTFHRLALAALEADPSGKTREYTTPGQCGSLRAQVDGNDIYPVYLDYGHDTTALCAAKANYGGNARLLNNSGEYVDPC